MGFLFFLSFRPPAPSKFCPFTYKLVPSEVKRSKTQASQGKRAFPKGVYIDVNEQGKRRLDEESRRGFFVLRYEVEFNVADRNGISLLAAHFRKLFNYAFKT